MMIPERFLELQERIHYEARNFKLHKEKGPPILSQNEILKYKCLHACICIRLLLYPNNHGYVHSYIDVYA